MRITAIREATASLSSSFRNASIDFSKMTLSVVAVITDVIRDGKPVVGFGFNSNGRYAQGGVLRERIIPRLLEANPASLVDDDGANFDPARNTAAMMSNEKPGGGYYDPDKGLDGLKAEMQGYRDAGYTLMKMKIGGAPLYEDMARIEAALEIAGAGENLAVDANAGLDAETALGYAKALEPYGLAWFEEPLDPLDYQAHADLTQAFDGPIATGENLFSLIDAKNLLRHGGLRPDRDWLQFDPSLIYGPSVFIEAVLMSEEMGWSRRRHGPHGGQQLGLHLTAGLQLGGTETYPLVFQPFGGFADETVIEDGTVRVSDAPGLGVETKTELYNNILKPLAEG